MKAILVSLMLGLAGCAAGPSASAPGCHGPRRPANPQGSVLAPGAVAPAPLSAPASGCTRGTQ